jgi:FMN reductase
VNRRRPLIVGVGGTLRDGSTSERALRLALRAAGAMGCSTEIFAGQAINLPPYDPADGRRSPEAGALVAALRRADGVILSSPGYHGTISGLLKNALDYTEDLRGDARRAWPTPFAAVVNSAGKPFASDGSCLSREIEQSLRLVAAQVVEFAQMRMAVDSVENEPAERGPAQPSSAELTERMTAMEMTFRLMG